MTDWTSGYITGIDYPYGYFKELNPLRIKLAFLSVGLTLPEIGNACELGFGQGMSVNLHAAASDIQWHGTDFNSSHAGFAQELAAASESGARLYGEAFADFAQRSDLPDFDYIGLHGVWSWINDENRAVIVDFTRRKLKPGGALYISYNTQPGWAAFAPIRHLIAQHAGVMGAIINRIDGALDFTEKMLDTNPIYRRANPQVMKRFKDIKEQDRRYLAHEYLNHDWHPMHFATIAEWLEPARLSYACSAYYLDHADGLNLTAEQQAFLKEIPDAMFRESVRDFMTNRQFRSDYWVKGARKLSALEQAEAFRTQSVVLTTNRADISLKVNGALGETALSEAIYNPIIDLVSGSSAQDPRPDRAARQRQGCVIRAGD